MKEITKELVMNFIPERKTEAHKGDFGRVLVIAGSRTMTGACVLSCEAALRSGAGLVYALVPDEIMGQVQILVPEVVIKDRAEGIPPLEDYDCIVIGPGLSTSEEAKKLVDEILDKAECPLILDADALNIISYNHWQDRVMDRCLRGLGTVITPHMGEAARLLKDDTDFDMEKAGREEILNELYYITGATVVLKGSRTLVRPMFGGSLDPVYVNTTGNPGMATAGSGDVLTGIIAALLGQGVRNSVMTGVYIHGLAGDLMAEEVGEYSLIARDIIKGIPLAFKNILEESNGI